MRGKGKRVKGGNDAAMTGEGVGWAKEKQKRHEMEDGWRERDTERTFGRGERPPFKGVRERPSPAHPGEEEEEEAGDPWCEDDRGRERLGGREEGAKSCRR